MVRKYLWHDFTEKHDISCNYPFSSHNVYHISLKILFSWEKNRYSSDLMMALFWLLGRNSSLSLCQTCNNQSYSTTCNIYFLAWQIRSQMLLIYPFYASFIILVLLSVSRGWLYHRIIYINKMESLSVCGQYSATMIRLSTAIIIAQIYSKISYCEGIICLNLPNWSRIWWPISREKIWYWEFKFVHW